MMITVTLHKKTETWDLRYITNKNSFKACSPQSQKNETLQSSISELLNVCEDRSLEKQLKNPRVDEEKAKEFGLLMMTLIKSNILTADNQTSQFQLLGAFLKYLKHFKYQNIKWQQPEYFGMKTTC